MLLIAIHLGPGSVAYSLEANFKIDMAAKTKEALVRRAVYHPSDPEVLLSPPPPPSTYL